MPIERGAPAVCTASFLPGPGLGAFFLIAL